jgi:hypothetical protein
VGAIPASVISTQVERSQLAESARIGSNRIRPSALLAATSVDPSTMASINRGHSRKREGEPTQMSKKPRFEPEQSWQPLEARIATERDPRCKQLLEQVRDHMRTEILGDFEGLMATLIDEPEYHLWGTPVEGGPKGRAEVEAFYQQMISGGGNWFHFDIQRIVVDHDSVVTEGLMRMQMPGAAVAASGISDVDGQAVEEGATYLAITQILTVWPAAEDGRIIGEDIYFGSPPMAKLRK